MTVAAGPAAPRPLSVLPGAAEPNVVVTHPGLRCGDLASETRAAGFRPVKGTLRIVTVACIAILAPSAGKIEPGDASEEEAEDFASQMFPPRLLVIHDAAAGGQHNEPKLTGGKQVVGPLLDISDTNIKPVDNRDLISQIKEETPQPMFFLE